MELLFLLWALAVIGVAGLLLAGLLMPMDDGDTL